MSSATQRPQRKAGFLSALLAIVLSIGGYYVLRAFGVGVFWSLTAPAILVAAVTVASTVRRRRTDVVGLLVLAELAVAITFTLATQSARVAALREPAYIFVGGVFCLSTLFWRTPLTHVTTSSVATFGDPRRQRAFDHAWREVPEYRRWQRLLTTSIGLIMAAAAAVRAYVLVTAPDDGLAGAIDLSNIMLFVMLGALVLVSGILIQPPKRIIERLVEQM